jgi:uncharacterized protein (DUF58 family)
MTEAIPKELLKKIKRLEIDTRKIVQSTFSGSYLSAFKGQGIDFSDIRTYQVGDDVRQINWSVSARSDEIHTNLFEEERELLVLLLVDISGSNEFGTLEKTKRDIIAEVSAILGFSAIHNQDKVGLILCSDRVEAYIPPAKGKNHMLRLLREVFYYRPKSKKTALSVGLDFAVNVLKKKALIFVFSDFIDAHYHDSLKLAASKHDVVPVFVEDRHDITLPKVGMLALEDTETGETVYINSSLESVQQAFQSLKKTQKNEQERCFGQSGCDWISLRTDEEYTLPLVKFFKKRRR